MHGRAAAHLAPVADEEVAGTGEHHPVAVQRHPPDREDPVGRRVQAGGLDVDRQQRQVVDGRRAVRPRHGEEVGERPRSGPARGPLPAQKLSEVAAGLSESPLKEALERIADYYSRPLRPLPLI